MEFLDFSPPWSPSLNDQQDALQKGLGRAVLWAMSGQLTGEPLLDACLHDQRFDVQCEDSRGEWLWIVLNSSGMVERFRQPILDAFKAVRAEKDACQWCELALHYARTGDDEFRAALYRVVELKPIAECPWMARGSFSNWTERKPFG